MSIFLGRSCLLCLRCTPKTLRIVVMVCAIGYIFVSATTTTLFNDIIIAVIKALSLILALENGSKRSIEYIGSVVGVVDREIMKLYIYECE